MRSPFPRRPMGDGANAQRRQVLIERGQRPECLMTSTKAADHRGPILLRRGEPCCGWCDAQIVLGS